MMEGEQRFVVVTTNDRILRMDTMTGESWRLDKRYHVGRDAWRPIDEPFKSGNVQQDDGSQFAQFIREKIQHSRELNALERAKWLGLLDEWEKEYNAQGGN